MVKQLVCPRCESNALVSADPQQFSKYPGLTCEYCQLSMRSHPSIFVPLFVVVLATAAFVVTALPWLGVLDLGFGPKLSLLLPFLSLSIAVCYLHKMTLPSPKVVEDEAVGDRASH